MFVLFVRIMLFGVCIEKNQFQSFIHTFLLPLTFMRFSLSRIVLLAKKSKGRTQINESINGTTFEGSKGPEGTKYLKESKCHQLN